MVTLPSPNPIPNEAIINYSYEVDPSIPLTSTSNITNIVSTTINIADIDLTKNVSPSFAAIGDTLTYTVTLRNTGNVTADVVTFFDTIPSGTSYVNNSFKENTVVSPGANPQNGVLLNNIAPSGISTVTFQVTVTTIPIPNPIPNTSDTAWSYTVNPSIPDGSSSRDTSNQVTTQVNQATISTSSGGLTKSVNPNFTNVGGSILYTIVLKNTGNTSADNVNFFDTIPTDTTLVANSVTLNGVTQSGVNPQSGVTVGTLGANAVATITFTVTVNTIPSPNPIPNTGDVAYTYTVDPSTPDGSSTRNTTNQVTTQVNQATISPADGGLVKSVDKVFADVNDTITYTIVLKNTGNTAATSVTVFDTIPTDTTFVANSVTINGVTQGGANPQSGVNVGTLGPNTVTTLTFSVTVNTIPSPNPIPNTADVSYLYTIDPSTPNGASARNTTNQVTTQVNSVTINNNNGSLIKTVIPSYAKVGDTVLYTIVIKNTGNVSANNLTFQDTIPTDTTFVNNSLTVNSVAQPGVSPQNGILIGNLLPSQVATVTFNVTINTIPSPNPIPNTGNIAYTYTVDPSNPNATAVNSATNIVTTQVNQATINNNDGSFVKSVDKAFDTVGGILTYTAVLKNTGNVIANNVIFTDTIPTDTTFVVNTLTVNGIVQTGLNPQNSVNVGNIAPNGVTTVTFQVTVNTIPSPNPIPNTSIINYTYTIDPSNPNGGSSSSLSNQVTTLISKGSLGNGGIIKSVDKTVADVNNQLTYTIVLRNTGNATINNIILTDTIPTNTNFVPNSVTINSVVQPGANPQSGIPVGTIAPNAVSTVTFNVTIVTIPSPNPIPNSASATYNYTIDPSLPNGGSGGDSSNIVTTQVNNANFNGNGSNGGIVKTTNMAYAAVGDIVTYTIVLTNKGNVAANNTVFTDTIPTDTTFVPNSVTINGITQSGINPQIGVPIGTIGASQVATITFQVTINTIPNPNPIPNTGLVNYNYTVLSTLPNGASGQNLSNTVTTQVNQAYIQPSDGGLVKSVNKAFADVNDIITYTIVLKNTGNTSATSVTVFDTIPTDTTFVANSVTINGATQGGANPQSGITVGTLAPNAVATLTFSVTVNTIPSPNPIPNTADVSYLYTIDPSTPNGASARNTTNQVTTQVNSVTINNNNGSLIKTVVPSYAKVGDTVLYTIVIKNNGNVSANNLTFQDTIPTDTTFVNNSLSVNSIVQPGVSPQGGILIGNLLPSQVATVTFNVTINTIPSPNPIPNTGNIAYTYTVDPSNPNATAINSATNIVTTQVNQATISNNNGGFVKSVDKAFDTVGGILTYTAVLKNTGNVMANNVIFTDTIPTDTTFVTNTFTINGIVQAGINPQNSVNVGNIAPNGVTTVTFQVTVNTIPSPNPIPNTSIINYTYTIDPSTPNGGSSSSLSNQVTTLISKGSLSNGGIVKSVDKTVADVNNQLTYTIVLKNTGNATVNNIILKDTIPTDTTFVTNSVTINSVVQPGANPQSGIPVGTLAPNAVSTVTFKVTVVTIPSPNPIPNSASATYNYTIDPSLPNGGIGGDSSNIVTTQVNNANFNGNGTNGGIVKTTNMAYAAVGDIVTYTIALTNKGNVAANNTVFTDTIPTYTTFVPNSVTLNGVTQSGINPQTGVPIGTIGASQVATITFQVTINTIPSPNPIPNTGLVNYNYTVLSTLPNGASGQNLSNTVTTQVNQAYIQPSDGGLVKSVNKAFADLNDTITYTIVLKNTGNTAATSVTVFDTIPTGTTFVPNSVTVNTIIQSGINPQTGILIGTISPNSVSTVTFQVIVNTIPSVNPIPNTTDVAYKYTVDPLNPNGYSSRNTSNQVTTQVNTGDISQTGNLSKSANPSYAKVGDSITYTIVITNNGNVTVNNMIFQDTIPNDTTFVPNSLTVNASPQPGINPQTGVSIGSLAPGSTSTITFNVTINTIPSPNPIPNSGNINYTYTVDPANPNGVSKSSVTNIATTQVNQANILPTNGGFTKYVNKAYATVKDVLTYTIVLKNSGNVSANNIIFTDTIPTDTTFVNNSVMVNGVVQGGANPQSGVNIGSIAPNGVATVTFQVTVNTLPSPNPIPNTSIIGYNYTIDPSIPNGGSSSYLSNTVATQINFGSINNGDGGLIKYVDQSVADLNQQLTYTIALKNTGNVTVTNLVLKDTIPTNTVFVPTSVFVNSVNQPALNPQSGIPVSTIAPNQTVTVTFKVTATTLPSPNPIPNNSTVNYNFTIDPSIPNGGIGSGNSNTVTTQIFNANFNGNGTNGGMIKSVNENYGSIGDLLIYTIVLTNKGNVDATNVVFFDTIPTNTTFVSDSLTLNGSTITGANPQAGVTIGTISPNNSVTVSFNVTIDTIPSPNPIPNSSIITYNYTVQSTLPNGASGTNLSNIVTTQVNDPNINNSNGSFTKYKDKDYVSINDTITYTFVIKNPGNTNANNVTIFDTIPNGTAFVPNSVTINGSTQIGSNPQIGVIVGTLSPGSITTLSYKVITTTVPSPNPIPNTGDIAYTYTVNPSIPNGGKRRLVSNQVTTTFNSPIIDNPVGSLFKNVNKAFSTIGDILTYTINMTNIGNATAINLVFTDTIPTDTTFVVNSVTVDGVPQPGSNPQTGVSIGTLAPTESSTVVFNVLVTTIPSPNPIPNSGTVNYNYTLYPTLPNGATGYGNTNIATTQVNSAVIKVSKLVNESIADIGSTLTFTIVATNTGNTSANNVLIQDTIPSGTTLVNDSVTLNGSTILGGNPQTGINTGTIGPNGVSTVTFKVTVVSIPSPNPIVNSVTTNFSFLVNPTDPNSKVTGGSTGKAPGVQVNNASLSGSTKSSNPSPVSIGDTITYTITIPNSGSVTANNVILSDPIPVGTTFVPGSVIINGSPSTSSNPAVGMNLGSIAPGATTTVTFQVKTNVSPIPTVPITNTATIRYSYTNNPNNPDITTQTTTNTVTSPVQYAKIDAAKTSNKSIAQPGDVITYSITMINSGNITANNVLFTDTLPQGSTFVTGSVYLDNINQPVANVEYGFSIDTIAPNQTRVLTYKVLVNSMPSNNRLTNNASINYTFTSGNRQLSANTNVSNTVIISYSTGTVFKFNNCNRCLSKNTPWYNCNCGCSTIPNVEGDICSNSSFEYTVIGLCSELEKAQVNTTIQEHGMWAQVLSESSIKVVEDNLTINTIESLSVSYKILRKKVISTPGEVGAENLESTTLTGKKLLVDGILCIDITVISGTKVVQKTLMPTFSAILVVNNTGDCYFDVGCCIENVMISDICDNTISFKSLLLVYATPLGCNPDEGCFCEENDFIISEASSCNISSFLGVSDNIWKEFSIQNILTVDNKIDSVSSVSGNITILDYKVIDTPSTITESNEGKTLTGKKITIQMLLNVKIFYTPIGCTNTLIVATTQQPFSIYLIAPSDTKLSDTFKIDYCIEDLIAYKLDCNDIAFNATVIIKATKRSIPNC